MRHFCPPGSESTELIESESGSKTRLLFLKLQCSWIFKLIVSDSSYFSTDTNLDPNRWRSLQTRILILLCRHTVAFLNYRSYIHYVIFIATGSGSQSEKSMRIGLDPDPKHWRTLIETVRQWELEKHLEKYHGCAPSTPVLFLDYAHQQDPPLEVREVRILLVLSRTRFIVLKLFLLSCSFTFGIFKKTLAAVSRIRSQLPSKNCSPKKKKWRISCFEEAFPRS